MYLPQVTGVPSDAAALGLAENRDSLAGTAGGRVWELLPLVQSANDFSVDFGELVEVDAGGNVAVADGVLKIKGSGAWNANGVYSPLVNFASPGRVRIKLTPKTAYDTAYFMIGAVRQAALDVAEAFSPKVYIDDATDMSIYSGGGGLLQRYVALVVDTQYQIELSWFADHTICLRMKGGVFTDWTEIHRGVYIHAGTQIAFQVNFVSAVATQWEFDDYERANGYDTTGKYISYVWDAGAGQTWDNFNPSSMVFGSGLDGTNKKLRWSFDDGTPGLSGWLTLAAFNAVGKQTGRHRYIRLDVQHNSDGGTQVRSDMPNAADASAGSGDFPASTAVAADATVQAVAGGIALASILTPRGTFDEAARNTVPTLSLVPTPATGGPATWKQLNVDRTGTQDLDAVKAAYEAARNSMNGTVGGDIRTGKSVKVANVTTDGSYSAEITNPAQPTISAARLTDTSARVTVDGDSGVTNYVVYADLVDGIWHAGGNRSGDGTVDVTGLTSGHTYLLAAYSLHSSGGLSEWSSAKFYTSGPVGGAVGAYTAFISGLHTAVQTSSALLAKITDGLPANHVKRGRFVHTDAASLAGVLAGGPVVYVRYVPYSMGVFTHESSRGNLTAELTVLQVIDQSASDDLTIQSNFVEALKQEIMAGINGSGTSWNARAFGVRCEVGEPQVVTRDVLATVIRIPAGYTEDI